MMYKVQNYEIKAFSTMKILPLSIFIRHGIVSIFSSQSSHLKLSHGAI